MQISEGCVWSRIVPNFLLWEFLVSVATSDELLGPFSVENGETLEEIRPWYSLLILCCASVVPLPPHPPPRLLGSFVEGGTFQKK